MAGTTNTELLQAIHELDKKLVGHLGLITEQEKKVAELRGDIYNHDEGGIKFQNKTMWSERKKKEKLTTGVKIAIATSVVNGLLAGASILGKL